MPRRAMSSSAPRSEFVGAIFDLDGTLTEPHALDFGRMRRRCGIPEDHDILSYISSLSAEEQARAHAIIVEEEQYGMDAMKTNAGFTSLVESLSSTSVLAAICTRNNDAVFTRFRDVVGDDAYLLFNPLLQRDYVEQAPESTASARVLRNKPHPDPAFAVLRAWGKPSLVRDAFGLSPGGGRSALDDNGIRALAATAPSARGSPSSCDPSSVLFVGDFLDDLVCGRSAGMTTVLVTNDEQNQNGSFSYDFLRDSSSRGLADYVVKDLSGVASLLSTGNIPELQVCR